MAKAIPAPVVFGIGRPPGESVDPRGWGISIRREQTFSPPRGESVRRCLHAFLVGLLTLSMSMNAARACWFVRHGCHARHPVAVACPPATYGSVDGLAVESCGGWSEPGVDITGGWQIVSDVAVGEPVDGGVTSCECGGTVDAEEQETVVIEHSGVSSSVAGPAVEHLAVNGHRETDATDAVEAIASPQPTLADAPAAVTVLAPTDEVRQATALGEPEIKPEAEVVLPVEPLAEAQPATVTDPEPPMEEDVAEVDPMQETTPAPVVSTETNIFEEVDQAAAADVIVPQQTTEFAPTTEEAAGVDTPVEDHTNSEPAPAPAADAPAEELPATESPSPEDPAAPADPFDAADQGRREPTRRWIDRSGDYAVVGALRAVRGDGTCVLDAAGRTIEVPLQALSDFDRSYATEAAERLTAASGPESSDTAGL